MHDFTVLKWEPLSAAMTDALVELPDGRQMWVASHTLPGWAGLRQRVREIAVETQRQQLLQIRANFVAEWHRPWPGCEFAKALIGRAIDAALQGAQ
jgi:hypothetical protein